MALFQNDISMLKKSNLCMKFIYINKIIPERFHHFGSPLINFDTPHVKSNLNSNHRTNQKLMRSLGDPFDFLRPGSNGATRIAKKPASNSNSSLKINFARLQ